MSSDTSYSQSSSSAPSFEKLRGSENYCDWSFAMKMLLRHEDLWLSIDGYPEGDTTTEAVKNKKEQKTLTKICLMIQPCCYPHVRQCEKAIDAWNNLKAAYEDKGLNRRITLLRTLCSIRLENFSKMEDYVNEFMTISQKLSAISKPVDDELLGAMMLQGLPENYNPMVMAIEHSGAHITSDLIKSKLLQDTKWENNRQNSNKVLWSKQENIKNARSKKPWCWGCRSVGHYKQDCPNKKSSDPSFFKSNKKNDQNKQNNTKKAFLTALGCVVNRQKWYVDSGASSHMTSNKDWLVNYSNERNVGLEVSIANNQVLYSEGIGDIPVNIKANSRIELISDVTYVPNLASNLLSISQMVSKGFVAVFDETGCKILENCVVEGDTVATATQIGGVYCLDVNTQQTSFLSNTKLSQEVWHKRLGHLNRISMRLLRDKMATGIDFSNKEIKDPCESCIKGKHFRKPFKMHRTGISTHEKLELIHMDLCGPMPVESWGGSWYYFCLIDDFTRKVFVYFLRQKCEATEVFKEFKQEVENETNLKIKKVRCDNGKEFSNRSLSNFLKRSGIKFQLTVPYTPEENGVVERMNRTIMDKTRSMMQESSCDHRFWAEAVNTSVYLINRSPTKLFKDMAPEEKWSGKEINLNHLRIFGSIAYVHIPKQKRRKLDSRSQKMVFVGYSEEAMGYRLFDSKTHEISRARDVIFLEGEFLADEMKNKNVQPFSEVFAPILSLYESENKLETLEQEGIEFIPNDEAEDIEDVFENQVLSEEDISQQQNLPDQDSLDHIPERYPVRDRKPRDFSDFVLYQTVCDINEPKTYKEAISSDFSSEWKAAMQDEIDSLYETSTWTLVEKPAHVNIVKSKWIFKVKQDADGNTIRYKARLVAKGFTQEYGIDYFDTFSPVIRHSSIRLLFALAVQYNLQMEQLDVVTAFLNGILDETIYMYQPEGFVVEGEKNKVCLLHKALYGLKQAARSWNKKVDEVLKELNFKQSKHESCIYILEKKKSMVIIALYVDDFFLFHNDLSEIVKLKKQLSQHFKIKDLGATHNCLGMKIQKNSDGSIAICQKKYILDVLCKFGMLDCKPVSTPMEPKIKLPLEESKTCIEVPYQELIGCLMYLSVTSRPDISYACSYLSQFNSKHNEEHWQAAKRVLRYLKGTADRALVYRKSNEEITGYTDADYASDATNRKSYTGYCFIYANAVVSWECRKQTTIAMSSCEAEYMALSESAKEAVHLRGLLSELVNFSKAINIYNDNQSAQKVANNPILNRRTKHIDVRFHFIREKIANGEVKLAYLPTSKMIADICTKPLPRPKLEFCVEAMGLS